MSFDEEMRRRAGREDCPTPEGFDGWLEDQLDALPRRGRPARRWGMRLAALAAAAVTLTACVVGAAELNRRQVRYQYFATTEEARQAALEDMGGESDNSILWTGLLGPIYDFRPLEPWDLDELMSYFDEITAYALGGPGDGWTGMFTGVNEELGTVNTSTYYLADDLSGFADLWPVEPPDLAWLEEHYRFLESGQCLLDWKSQDPDLAIDMIAIEGACYGPEGAPVTLSWSFYEKRRAQDHYFVAAGGLSQVEEYTTADGAVVTIEWRTSVNCQPQFRASYGYDRAAFHAAGAELEPDQVRELLDHLNLTSLASWQP